jgi:hypothetical protein
MSILRPGFSERVFEFSFNAEYTYRNQAVLAGAPGIPTQNEEFWLGYDVAFEIQQHGGAVHTLALQHKVARFVDGRGPSNGHYWLTAGGPYFAFRLDIDQYNLIESIATAALPGVEFYFCAPVFATRHEMNSHFLGKTVETSSVWIDVSSAGQLTPGESHTIVYTPDGSQAFLFSEQAKKLKTLSNEQRKARWEQRRNNSIADSSVAKLYDITFASAQATWPRRRQIGSRDGDDLVQLPVTPPVRQDRNIANTAKLLAQYFGASLLVETRN